MDFLMIFNQILVLFLILFVGYLLFKINILDDHTNKKLSSFVVNVSAPALIISAFTTNSKGTLIEIINIIVISLFCYLFLFAMTIILPRFLKIHNDELGIYKFMVMFSNVGFMGFPVISAIYGNDAIFYASIFNLPFYLLIYTLGVYYVSLHAGQKIQFNYRRLLNSGVIAVIIGIVLFSTKLKPPYFINETIGLIGGVTTPLSMLIIGASLAKISIKDIFSSYKLYIFSLIKLVFLPIVIYFILKPFSTLISNPILIGISVVIVGMPVAANAVMLSKEYNGNEEIASKGVFISTLLSIVTIPLLVYLLTVFK